MKKGKIEKENDFQLNLLTNIIKVDQKDKTTIAHV